MMMHFASLWSVLLLVTSMAERAGCDDAECLDEKQVFVQLRSEVRDSKDSDTGVAAHPRWRRRRRFTRFHPFHPYHPYGPTSTTTTITTTSTTTSTTISTVTIPVCRDTSRLTLRGNFLGVDISNTTVLLTADEGENAGCCIQDISDSVVLDLYFGKTIAGNGSTVSLEAPDGQSHELGVALPGQDRFEARTDIFQGAVVSGSGSSRSLLRQMQDRKPLSLSFRLFSPLTSVTDLGTG